MPGARNVVLICADQWRGDALSAAGHPVVRTPYLDQLAERGVRFSRAYSATPTCVPARAALMTGLGQRSHGRVGYQDGVPWEYPVTLPGTFRAAGYHTQAVGKMHVWPERARLGFDDVLLHDGYLHWSYDRRREAAEYDDYAPWARERGAGGHDVHGIDCNSVVARPWDRPEELHPTNWVAEQGIRWLHRRDPTVPFFLYLSFHRPHPPYDPPRWAYEQYAGAGAHRPEVGDWAGVYEPWRRDGRADANVADYPQDVLDRARNGYYGAISHVDQQINRFLQALAEFGLGEDTVVAFTSDHGEMLGEHGLFRKGYPYEGSARVPLLLAAPGVGGGTVCEEVVELRDVMPTLLECAGVEVPEGVEGRSLLPWARGLAVEPVRGHLHGEHALLGQSLQWIVTGRWKYVWLSGQGVEQLFDLVADPGELRDLSGQGHPELAVLRALLVTELTGREEGYVADGRLVPGREPVTVLGGR
ncbi:arylsulfatase [Kitasatospora sp. NPDC002040]|uniref:arylsulfatase n=1 Tax=Kitasatospora sp. NPDC002040 TaxID=3154661 RepID=UPI00332CE4CF